MPANTPETIQPNASPIQAWVFRFVAVIALGLILLPILPMLLTNLIYSFSGEAPKIYWYLSRASGFVTLTILWAAMAMGLGITNKMIRLWPGAPTAFSIHQYTSLLGLAFAIYHGLVLMGDHYTDFSLPRLATPFSIDYKTVWIGLGQTSFYVWMLVVLSFYVRQHIGQKTWRVIHYLNFAVYVMAFLHSAFTGTDSNAAWARGYFWISGLSILALLGYRIYESGLKNKISLPKFSFKRKQPEAVEISPAVKAASLPQALLREQARKPAPVPAAVSMPTGQAQPEKHPHPVPVMTPIVVKATEGTPAQEVTIEKSAQTAAEQNQAAPKTREQPVNVKAKPSSPIETIEDTSKGNKIKVRIFKEPTTLPITVLENSEDEADGELKALFIRVKQSFRSMPVEPPSPKRRVQALSSSD
jgi:hypothetical protein